MAIDGIREKWTIEHLRALGLGGDDSDANTAPAHERCRRTKDKADIKSISKAKRMKAKAIGIRKRSSFQTNRDGPFKQLIGGKTVLRNPTRSIP